MPIRGIRCYSLLLVWGVALWVMGEAELQAAKHPATSAAKNKAAGKSTSSAAKSQKKTAVKPKPASAPAEEANSSATAKVAAPAAGQTLADYLAGQLGEAKFHRRSEWAGKSGQYDPVLTPPRVWRPIGQVRHLTIHHAAGIPNDHPAAMIRNIFEGHTSPNGPLDGAADVGYHFLVDRNGDVWEARDSTKLGSHVGSTPPGLNNEGNIGICGLGTFNDVNPPKAMIDGIARLCGLISKFYHRPLDVRGHKDWKGIHQFALHKRIDCPGLLSPAIDRARAQIAAVQNGHAAGTTPVVLASNNPAPDKLRPAKSSGSSSGGQ
ncbi:N-acetylmuramoyl-L-alanine amidase [Candidatus Sumerlaeota bacterium]|nr:N-acetylmuramoyl-L-alanine amidase [Candidatus Sumerlaeota bacterium]